MTIEPKLLSAEDFEYLRYQLKFGRWYYLGTKAELLFSHIAALYQQIAAKDAEIERLIDQRDSAEEALSQAYFLVIGRSPEWSNLFGHAEALEEIDDAQHTFRAALTPQPKDQSR